MSYLNRSPKTTEMLKHRAEERTLIVYHFFDFRAGKVLNNNLEGFLRSLALQLLSYDGLGWDELRRLVPLSAPSMAFYSAESWPVFRLREVITDIIRKRNIRTLFLLDGLDEFAGNKHDLIDFVKQIASNTSRICIASRPEIPFPTLLGPFEKASMQDHNKKAIATFVQHKLLAAMIDGRDAQTWSWEVANRSAGVFLWARFAVDELIAAISMGLDPESGRVSELLAAIPQELDEMYHRKFQSLAEPEKRTAAMIFLLVTHCQVQNITLQLLWDVINHIPANDPHLPVLAKTAHVFRGSVKEQGFKNHVDHCMASFLALRHSGKEGREKFLDIKEWHAEIYHRTTDT